MSEIATGRQPVNERTNLPTDDPEFDAERRELFPVHVVVAVYI